MKKTKLNLDEKKILESYEAGQWQSVKKDTGSYVRAAHRTLIKDHRINIRLSKNDLEGIRTKAADEGIPYQTLIASVIHKYVSGRLNAA